MSSEDDILGSDGTESSIEETAKHFRECADCRKGMIAKYRWPAKRALAVHEEKLGRKLNTDEWAAFAAATVNLASYIEAAEALKQQAIMELVSEVVKSQPEKRDPTKLDAAIHAGFGKQTPGEA